MGIYDRDYSQVDYRPSEQPPVRFDMPTITPVVKWLLVVNILVYVVQAISYGTDPFAPSPIERWFSVFPETFFAAAQVWRWVTYQFLHATPGHLLFNMFVLFQFGPLIERQFGSRRFLVFYLSAGAAGGVLYTMLAVVRILPVGYLVGASGAILGLLGAGAVLYPHLRVLFMLIVPMSLRLLAIICVFISLGMILAGQNAGGEVAHLAGLAVGVGYTLLRPRLDGALYRRGQGRWQRKQAKAQALRREVDRILAKVHESGLQSLTRKERRMLKEATRLEQEGRL